LGLFTPFIILAMKAAGWRAQFFRGWSVLTLAGCINWRLAAYIALEAIKLMTTKSWIVTAIFAPIFVGLILLQAEHFFFSKDTPSKTASVESVSEKAQQVVKQIESVQKSEESFMEPDIGNLQTLFEVAKKIYGSTERNAEYVKLIHVALAEEKPGFAYKVAKEIYGSTERNVQFVNIIDKCLANKMFALSLQVAEQIYGSTERNAQYKKIIEAGTMERQNAVSNPALKRDALERTP
jgi:hypothetical protein